jgi:hypothetical protein
MTAMRKLLAILCLLLNTGCTNLGPDTQGMISHPIDARNLIIPIYHQDL